MATGPGVSGGCDETSGTQPQKLPHSKFWAIPFISVLSGGVRLPARHITNQVEVVFITLINGHVWTISALQF